MKIIDRDLNNSSFYSHVYNQTVQKPTAAFVLSLIGGIFVLIGGLAISALGAFVTFFAFGVGAVLGVAGIVFGILIIVFAALLNAHPEQHVTYGVLILVFSIVSWFGAFGGFFIGFLLGLIGGILAIVWKPVQAVPPQQAQMPPNNSQ